MFAGNGLNLLNFEIMLTIVNCRTLSKQIGKLIKYLPQTRFTTELQPSTGNP